MLGDVRMLRRLECEQELADAGHKHLHRDGRQDHAHQSFHSDQAAVSKKPAQAAGEQYDDP